MQDFNDRSRRLWGNDAFEKIRYSRVCVLGLGGVGSFALSSFVRGGVENLLLLDGDEVDKSNINRQALAFQSTVGKRKVEVAKDFALEINPLCKVSTIDKFILTSDVENVCDQIEDFKPDWIVDAIDSISIKLLLAEHFVRDNKFSNYISAMGAANKFDPTRFSITKLFSTKNDGLSRIMRKEARKREIGDFLVCASDEKNCVNEDAAITRSGEKKILGSSSFIPPIMGHMIAGYVMNQIASSNF